MDWSGNLDLDFDLAWKELEDDLMAESMIWSSEEEITGQGVFKGGTG